MTNLARRLLRLEERLAPTACAMAGGGPLIPLIWTDATMPPAELLPPRCACPACAPIVRIFRPALPCELPPD